MSTYFEYRPRTTFDHMGAPHVREDSATRVTEGTHYSCWGFAMECEGCGIREEVPGASSVTAEDYPRQFAGQHRDCLPPHRRAAIEREHLVARVQYIAERLPEGHILSHYGTELERIGKRLQEMHRH